MNPLISSLLLPLLGQVLTSHGHAPTDPVHTDATAVATTVAGVADSQIASLTAQLAAAKADAEHWRALATMMLQARGLVAPK